LKINHENKCKKCNDNYNINVNKNGSCDKGGQHDPMYWIKIVMNDNYEIWNKMIWYDINKQLK
jgi:hypothetical protein